MSKLTNEISSYLKKNSVASLLPKEDIVVEETKVEPTTAKIRSR